MDRNILKQLHEDLEKIIIDKYVEKYKLSIAEILIDHEKTSISYNIKDNKDDYICDEFIEFSNLSWHTK